MQINCKYFNSAYWHKLYKSFIIIIFFSSSLCTVYAAVIYNSMWLLRYYIYKLRYSILLDAANLSTEIYQLASTLHWEGKVGSEPTWKKEICIDRWATGRWPGQWTTSKSTTHTHSKTKRCHIQLSSATIFTQTSFNMPPMKRYSCPVSHLLLIPPSLTQHSIQAVSSRRPLLREPADTALHETEGLFPCSNVIQKYRQIRAKSSLQCKANWK